MKRLLKQLLAACLWRQVKRLNKQHSFQVVGVVGSVGKTSTKHAIATYLQNNWRVRYKKGNYNDILSVPLVFFGLEMPPLYNPFAWFMVWWRMVRAARNAYPYDIVVLELGTDGPGQIALFGRHIMLDVLVVTAIRAEHMESFQSLDAVAQEELAATKFARQVIVNADDVAKRYIEHLSGAWAYGADIAPSPRAVQVQSDGLQQVTIGHDRQTFRFTSQLIGEHMHKTLAAAYCVSLVAQLEVTQPKKALSAINGMPGRMQCMSGKRNTTLIDDTYNASPDAVVAALQVLYQIDAPYRIAVLGNMNEMGGYAKQAHQIVADYLAKDTIDEVLVLGHEASLFLARKAQDRGHTVREFSSPQAIGRYLAESAPERAAILFKGSQNGVYLEEAVKAMLANPADQARLVRQSAPWLKQKQRQFQDKTL